MTHPATSRSLSPAADRQPARPAARSTRPDLRCSPSSIARRRTAGAARRCAAHLASWGLLALALGSPPAAAVGHPAAEHAPLDAERWRRDLAVLARELPQLHPQPFHEVSEREWRAAVATLDARIPTSSRNEIVVGLMRLVAMLGEVHSALNPLYRPELAFHYLPILPYHFADGLYVRAAAPSHSALVGARILRIGNASAEEAFQATAAITSTDNPSGARHLVPYYLIVPELLDGLGLAAAGRPVPFELERQGRRFTVELSPAGVLRPRGHGPLGAALDATGWLDARRPDVPVPLHLRHHDRFYWSTPLPEQRSFYIQYNAVVDDHATPIADFFPRAIAEAEASGAERLILDLRHNGGGNGFLNRPIIKALIRSRFDQRGRLFLVVGRGTLSAAQSFVNEAAKWTRAILVGEPTGSRPNQYGDHAPLRLPESGLVVMVSTLYHQDAGPQDHRHATVPHLPAEPTFAEYRDGIDPALAAALAYRSITELLEPALAAGDLAEVGRLYQTFKSQPATAWIPTEVEINALGYRLLAAQRHELALALFRWNVESYPQSANTHDSLGEAYLAAGDRVRARASYQRALELDPESESARRALARLGGG